MIDDTEDEDQPYEPPDDDEDKEMCDACGFFTLREEKRPHPRTGIDVCEECAGK